MQEGTAKGGAAMKLQMFVRDKKQSVHRLLNKNQHIAAYLNNRALRAKGSLLMSAVINVAFVVTKLISGIYYDSSWMYAIAAYYFVLCFVRVFLLANIRRSEGIQTPEEARIHTLRRYRATGVLLLFVDQAMVIMIVLMIIQNQVYDYPGAMIYLSVFYVFYHIIVSFRNVVYFHKGRHVMLSASKMLELAAAIMSLYVVQVDLIARFGNDDIFRLVMNSVTGGVVILVVLAMAIYMVCYSSKKLKMIKNECRVS